MTRRRSNLRLAGLILLLLLPTACGSGTTGVVPGTVLPPFFLAGSTPLDGSTGVSLVQSMIAAFNKAVDPATVDAATLRVVSDSGIEMAGTVSILPGSGNDTLRWTPIHNLGIGEQHTCMIHTDLRSIDGEVLGGQSEFKFVTISGSGGNPLPTRDQLRPTLGTMAIGRQGHEATLLNDGRVLVTGGFTILGAVTDVAEVFHEGLGTFETLAGRMDMPRASHTATKLSDGRVLLAGGWEETSPGQNATVMTAEIFDPVTDTFSPVGNMTTERADHAAALLPNGTVLITGGSRLTGTFLEDLDTAEVFDPGTGMFTAHAETMTHTRATHGMVPGSAGKLVLAGGSDTDRRHDWFDIAADEFQDLGQAVQDQGRFGPAVAAYSSGGVVIAGGDLLGSVVYVFPGTGFVQNTGSGLNRPRSYATAVRIKSDQILVAGGIDFSRGGFIEASCDVIVEAGVNGANTFATEVRFTTGMAHHAASYLPTGDVLFCGGLNEDGSQPNKNVAFVFDVR